MQGLDLPLGTYIHINGTDLVRDGQGRFRVLEDNAPLAVRRLLRGREPAPDAARLLRPDAAASVRPVSDYGRQLHEKRCARSRPPACADPQVVLLSPGVFNSAYFEHVFLAREMGVPLVEGRDLVVEDDRVCMRTVAGLRRVDVIYRRAQRRLPRSRGLPPREPCWACPA